MSRPGYKSSTSGAVNWRPANSLLTANTAKTVKGESMGWVTGILYLQPHTMAGRKTVCPFSTAACRGACLYHAGMGDLARQRHARLNRTDAYWDDNGLFVDNLAREILDLRSHAVRAGMALAVRLNGTSDIDWEAEETSQGASLMELFPNLRFYDYTKWPIEKRMKPTDGGAVWPANYHLTYSMAEHNARECAAYLRAGQGVAVVVPEDRKPEHESWFMMGDRQVTVIDGDLHDLRFLDPPGSLVVLKPKGKLATGSELVRADPIRELRAVR